MDKEQRNQNFFDGDQKTKKNAKGLKIININLNNFINEILDDAKAEQICVLDLRKKTSITDFFIIATCRSSRHANAIADDLTKKLKKIGIKCPSPEGRPDCEWVIVDAGGVIVHLFKHDTRKLYNLEKLWEISLDTIENKLA